MNSPATVEIAIALIDLVMLDPPASDLATNNPTTKQPLALKATRNAG
jgi:hypothetical protein